jgi:multidrug efflux pump subunit AcrA (membrane-fusion protein)
MYNDATGEHIVAFIPNRRLRAEDIESDSSSLHALADIADYQPLNASYSASAVEALGMAMQQAQQAEARAQRTLAATRDAAQAAEWTFHNAILGVKRQIMAQYGPDSDAVHAIGLKKISDRKRPTRRARVAAPAD